MSEKKKGFVIDAKKGQGENPKKSNLTDHEKAEEFGLQGSSLLSKALASSGIDEAEERFGIGEDMLHGMKDMIERENSIGTTIEPESILPPGCVTELESQVSDIFEFVCPACHKKLIPRIVSIEGEKEKRSGYVCECTIERRKGLIDAELVYFEMMAGRMKELKEECGSKINKD